ncbi:HAD hydrolase-like protein [Paracoccus sp. (in: a-proteobacteria)]|uniref:HAD family hydrolase n=1 Tax=Paracoccus sp. TaxID=267 RepID=UPI0032206400
MTARGIVFELDGTLIHAASSSLASMNVSVDTAGFHPIRPFAPDMIDPPLRDALTAPLARGPANQANDVAEEFKRRYDSIGYHDTRVYDGVAETLAQPRQQHAIGRPTIAINKRFVPTRRVIEHLDWEDVFDEIRTFDAFTPPLSSKAALPAKRRPGLAAASACMGDRPEDTAAAVPAERLLFPEAWGSAHPTLHAAATPRNYQAS